MLKFVAQECVPHSFHKFVNNLEVILGSGMFGGYCVVFVRVAAWVFTGHLWLIATSGVCEAQHQPRIVPSPAECYQTTLD